MVENPEETVVTPGCFSLPAVKVNLQVLQAVPQD